MEEEVWKQTFSHLYSDSCLQNSLQFVKILLKTGFLEFVLRNFVFRDLWISGSENMERLAMMTNINSEGRYEKKNAANESTELSDGSKVTLADFLKSKRVVAGLSQKDVASHLGYSTSQFISNWERGISQPPLNTLRRIANLYKISPDEMFNVLLRSTIEQVERDLKRKFYIKNDLSN